MDRVVLMLQSMDHIFVLMTDNELKHMTLPMVEEVCMTKSHKYPVLFNYFHFTEPI